MRSNLRRFAVTVGAALLATVPLVSGMGSAPASGAAADQLTASYTTNPYPYRSQLTSTGQEYRQTFKATVTGQLTRTRIWLRSEFANYPPGGVAASVSVYNLNADNTLGAQVDTATTMILGASWPAPSTDTATFTGGQMLTSGNRYALVVRPDSSIYAEMAGTYADGRGWVCTAGTESCYTNYDSTWFEVYVGSPDSTPPVVDVSVAPDPVLQGLSATATFTATDPDSDITATTCDASFAVDTSVPGEHNLTCSATSAGGTAEDSYTYTVLTPTQGIAGLRADVVELGSKIAAPLSSQLDKATKSLAKGETTAAIDQLSSFISLVRAQDGKKIPSDLAADFIGQAQAIIASIQATS